MPSDDFLNLTLPRSDVDVWNQRRWQGRHVNDGVVSSLLSVAGVSLLAWGAYCARRSSGRGKWWLVSGASLVGYAAATAGHRYWTEAVRQLESPLDEVNRESVDSFPASDAPSSNATTATAQPIPAAEER